MGPERFEVQYRKPTERYFRVFEVFNTREAAGHAEAILAASDIESRLVVSEP